jgi:hypothetical protein
MNLMSLVSVISILLLGLLLITFTILLPVAIIFNTRVGMKYRESLANQLEQLRLGKMLAALGIDTESYLSSERTVDIRAHMLRCSACANTDECDSSLREGSVTSGNIDYCNNKASLRKIAERLEEG